MIVDNHYTEYLLRIFCNNGNVDKLKTEIEENRLDIIFSDGILFRLSASNASEEDKIVEESLEIFEFLLDYYKQTKMDPTTFGTTEYNCANYELRKILERVEDSIEISPEIAEIMTKYGYGYICKQEGNFSIFEDNEIGEWSLIDATADGDVVLVNKILKSGKIDIDLQEPLYGNTALHYAYQNGHNDIVELLLKTGTNQDIINNKGLKPMQVQNLNNISEEELQYITYNLGQELDKTKPLHDDWESYVNDWISDTDSSEDNKNLLGEESNFWDKQIV